MIDQDIAERICHRFVELSLNNEYQGYVCTSIAHDAECNLKVSWGETSQRYNEIDLIICISYRGVFYYVVRENNGMFYTEKYYPSNTKQFWLNGKTIQLHERDVFTRRVRHEISLVYGWGRYGKDTSRQNGDAPFWDTSFTINQIVQQFNIG